MPEKEKLRKRLEQPIDRILFKPLQLDSIVNHLKSSYSSSLAPF